MSEPNKIIYSSLETSSYCADLDQCSLCGAAVDYYRNNKHTQWHEQVNALAVTTSDNEYGPTEVYLGGILIGRRPWDGSNGEDIKNEVVEGLAAMLRERFGWPQTIEQS